MKGSGEDLSPEITVARSGQHDPHRALSSGERDRQPAPCANQNQKRCLADRSTIICYWGNPSPKPPGADGKENVMVFGEQSVNRLSKFSFLVLKANFDLVD